METGYFCEYLCLGLLWVVFLRLKHGHSSLSHNTSFLLNLGSMPFVSLLNRSVAGMGSPGLTSVDLICNKAMYMSVLVSKHLFMVLLTNFIHDSACPLL